MKNFVALKAQKPQTTVLLSSVPISFVIDKEDFYLKSTRISKNLKNGEDLNSLNNAKRAVEHMLSFEALTKFIK